MESEADVDLHRIFEKVCSIQKAWKLILYSPPFGFQRNCEYLVRCNKDSAF